MLLLPPTLPIRRPSWQALLSHLQLKSGHLAYTATNHLAFCDPCNPKTYGPCYCLDSDYGIEKTISYATVTLTGSGTGQSTLGACGSSFTWTGVNWNGTYTVACNSTAKWYAATLVCDPTIALGSGWVVEELELSHSFDPLTPGRQIFAIEINSYYNIYGSGAANPCSTITTTPCGTIGPGNRSGRTAAGYDVTLTYTDWEFNEGASCITTQTARGCATSLSAYAAWTFSSFGLGLPEVDHSTGVALSAIGLVNV